MIKKIKLSLLVAVLSLFATVGYVFAANTYNADTIVSMTSPALNLTILAGSSDDGLVVNAGTIVPTVSTGETFTVTNASGNLSVTPMASNIVITCSNTLVAQAVITGGASTAYTITPTNVPCIFPYGSGPLVSSGPTTSTVAQSPAPVTITITPVTPTTPAVTETTMSPGCSGGNKYNTSTGNLCVNTAVAGAKASYDFGTVTLRNGSKGEAVMELQRFLNAKLGLGLVVDGKLGPKTIKVIKQWQKDHGLVVDGLIGKKTKAKMNLEAASN